MTGIGVPRIGVTRVCVIMCRSLQVIVAITITPITTTITPITTTITPTPITITQIITITDAIV